MSFAELVRLLEKKGFALLKEKGSIRYYRKQGHDKLIRVDYHGKRSRQVPVWLFSRRLAFEECKENRNAGFALLIGY